MAFRFDGGIEALDKGSSFPNARGHARVEGLLLRKKTANAVNTSATLTVTQLTDGIITSTTASGAVSGTLPTAAAIVAGVAPSRKVGDTIDLTVINTGGTNTFTISGGTTVGSMVVAAASSAQFLIRLDNVTASSEAISVYRIA